MFFRNAQNAFNDAIAGGYLSVNPQAANYAGRYMYMHSLPGADLFKHVDTRQYLDVPASREAEPEASV